MNTNNNEPLLLANENTILRIVLIAKIVGWIMLAFYLVSSWNDISSIMKGQVNLPTQFFQWITMLVNLLFKPVVGLFYLLILHGLAQGLNLGLDIYYELNPENEDEQD